MANNSEEQGSKNLRKFLSRLAHDTNFLAKFIVNADDVLSKEKDLNDEDKEVIKSGDIGKISRRVMGMVEAPTVVVVSDLESLQKTYASPAPLNLVPTVTIHPNLVVLPNVVVHPVLPNVVVHPVLPNVVVHPIFPNVVVHPIVSPTIHPTLVINPTIHPTLVINPTIHPNLVVQPTIHPNLVVQPTFQAQLDMVPVAQNVYYNPNTGTYHYY